MSMHTLPTNIWQLILTHLSPYDVLHLNAACVALRTKFGDAYWRDECKKLEILLQDGKSLDGMKSARVNSKFYP